MDEYELSDHLSEQGFSFETVSTLKDKGISGETFLDLNREDLAILFPNDFLSGKKLFKYISNFNTSVQSSNGSFFEGSSPSNSTRSNTEISPRTSTPKSTASESSTQPLCNTPATSKKRSGGPAPPSFMLPKFDASLEQALTQDGIYDSNTRAKLIRKSCEHLEGFCLEHNLKVTKERQENLASLLLERAPLSLSDPPGTKRKKVSQCDKGVGLKEQIKKWFYNHTHSIKKSLGETKKRKKDDSPSPQAEQEDDDTLKAHCAVIEKECKKKDGAKDYNKIFRLLSATREYRRRWMLSMNAPTRVAVSLSAYPCLKKPLMAFNDFLVEHKDPVATVEELEAKMKGLSERFYNCTMPALLELAKQNDESSITNDTSILEKLIFVLQFIIRSLRCCKKENLSDAVNSIMYVTEDPSVATLQARTNTAPFIVVEGTLSEPKWWYIICEKRLVTYKINAEDGKSLITSLITLIAVYFTYYLEYKKDVFMALTFLQEKLTSTPVSVTTKTHYNNLFRSVTLFEQKLSKDTQA